MRKQIGFILTVFLILCVVAAGCISNNRNSTENAFEPDNFLKTASLSEDNATLTMIFDEDFASNFHWELIVESDDVLKIMANEKMPANESPQKIGKHKWVFEGNETGVAELRFDYIDPSKKYTPERYAYTIRNTNGNLEILSFSSFSGNRTRNNPQYTESAEVIENDTRLSLFGSGVESSGAGYNHWKLEKLEQSQNDVLIIVNATSSYYSSDPGYGGHQWEIEGQTAGNASFTLNYVSSKAGLISEIIYEIQVNENKEIAIRNISYNSVKGEPMPHYIQK